MRRALHSRVRWAPLLLILPMTAFAACMDAPDITFEPEDDAAAASLGPAVVAEDDAGDASDAAFAAEDAVTSVDAPAHPPPSPPPTDAASPGAVCPLGVPPGATTCCGAVPCVGSKCATQCVACAACTGAVCCVPDAKSFTCAASAAACKPTKAGGKAG
jgi:hypothetical protein